LSDAIAATATLTSDGTAPADGATVTIGTVVYTFKTGLTGAANQVLIGGSADAALLNLIRAINHTGTPGTDYSAATVIHPTASAAAAVTNHTVSLTAKTSGQAGNAIASTETSAHLAFGGAAFTGGQDLHQVTLATPVAPGDVLVAFVNGEPRTPVLVGRLWTVPDAPTGALVVVRIVKTTTQSCRTPYAFASDDDKVHAEGSTLPLVIFG